MLLPLMEKNCAWLVGTLPVLQYLPPTLPAARCKGLNISRRLAGTSLGWWSGTLFAPAGDAPFRRVSAAT